MKLYFVTLALLTLTLVVLETDARLPGVKIRITKKGIDYANSIAQAKLAEQLKTLKIPDQGGNENHMDWSLWNIQVLGVSIPTTSMSLAPAQKGLTWTMANLGINLHADWRVKYRRHIIKISTSGNVDLGVSGVSVSITIALGADGQGKPTISMAGCNAQVNGVSVKFHGGVSKIINMFRGTLGRKAKDFMRDQICKVVQKEVNVDGAQALSKLKLTVKVGKKFDLDYSLMAAPGVQANFLETQHKGEVYWHGDGIESPLTPKAFPPLEDASKMMYLWLSEFTPNSASTAAQKHGFLQYNLTEADLPEDYRSYLDTSCTLKCIGKIIPTIGWKYPNSKVEARITTISAPVTSMTKDSISLDTRTNVTLIVHTPDNNTHFLISLSVNASLSVKVSVVNERLIGEVVDYSFEFGVFKSDIGTILPSVLNVLIKGALKLSIVPRLNRIAQQGVDLPVTGGVKFSNFGITQLDGSFYIGTDVQYLNSQLHPNSLRFQSEHDHEH